MTMKRSVVHLLAACILLAGPAAFAEKTQDPTEGITLEDVIFDANLLKQGLGANTLIVSDKKNTPLPTELTAAISAAGFADKTRLYDFPENARRPKLKKSIPYTYPRSLRQGKTRGHANFLVALGADGAVRGLYCYEHSDRLFALAAAAAIVKWRYEPAAINDTAVPVLMEVPMHYRGDGYDNDFSRTTTGKNPAEMPRNNP